VDTVEEIDRRRNMTKNCLVSVVIATWNRKDDLRESIEHYKQQSYKNVEIIVVDNNSTDGTIEMLEQNFPSVQLIKLSKNTGVVAYNIGMKAAKGEIIVVSDNDSYLEQTGIEKIIRKFDNGNTNLAVVACEIIYVPNNVIYHWYQHPVVRQQPKIEGYPAHLFIGAGAAIKKKVLEEVGYYPEEFFIYMNEVDLCTRILGAGYDIRYYPDVVSYHKFTQAARSRSRTKLLSFRNIIWYYWKNFPFHIALGRSLVRIPFEIIQLTINRTNLLSIVNTLFQIIKGFPAILKHRKPIPKQYIQRTLDNKSELGNLWHYSMEVIQRRRRMVSTNNDKIV
jgi:GT2 family glycosyltransferase